LEIEALDLEMLQFEREARELVDQAAREMVEQSQSTEEKAEVRAWRDEIRRQIDTIIRQDAPLLSLVDAWHYAVCLSENCDPEDIAGLSPPNQETALATSTELREWVRSAARVYLPRDVFLRTRTELNESAKQSSGEKQKGFTPFSATDRGKQAVSFLASVPLSPITTLGKVGQGASSFSDMASAANRFTDVMGDLPTEMRLEVEELMRTLGVTDQLTSAVLALQQTNRTIDDVSARLETYPEEIRQATVGVLDRTVEAQPELRQTLQQSQQALGQMETTITQAERLGKTLDQTAQSIKSATEEINRLANPPGKETSGGGGGKPFDINEYRRTAEELTKASARIEQVIVELRGLLESDALPRTTQAAEETAGAMRAEGETLVDHLFWRLIQLAVVVFVLALAYQLIARFWLKPRRNQASPHG